MVSRSDIDYRNHPQVRELLETDSGDFMDYMDDEAFHKRGARKALFDDVSDIENPVTDWYMPSLDSMDVETVLRAKTNRLLTAEQEKVLFLQFNYARFMVASIQERFANRAITRKSAADLLDWFYRSNELRDRIVQFNLGLVLAMIKHVAAASRLDYMEMISEGNLALLRAVDKFDVSRSFKFSTYACRAILKAFSRMSVTQSRRRSLFPVSVDTSFDEPTEQMTPDDLKEYAAELKRIIDDNEAGLDEREQQVLQLRFPFEDDRNYKITLKEVGQMIGYSKERVRQIQRSALAKLRQVMELKFSSHPLMDG